MHVKCVVAHDCTWPHLGHELVLAHQRARGLGQNANYFKCMRAEGDRYSGGAELAPTEIDLPIAQGIDRPSARGSHHLGPLL
jgi:hypothetical protein